MFNPKQKIELQISRVGHIETMGLINLAHIISQRIWGRKVSKRRHLSQPNDYRYFHPFWKTYINAIPKDFLFFYRKHVSHNACPEENRCGMYLKETLRSKKKKSGGERTITTKISNFISNKPLNAMAKRLNYIFRTYLIYFIFKIAVPL
jgi:hypothetical protein